MQAQAIPTQKAFRLTGSLALFLAVFTVISSALAYIRINTDFSIFTTYLSDIGDTPGWPQVLFNSGTILAAPLRYAIVVLLVLRLRSYQENSRTFEIALLSIGAFSTLGTIFMTAVPFSVGPIIHKTGIGLYFLGVVFLQTLVGLKELSIKRLPRSLPLWSFTVVISYLVFFVLVILYETGAVGRNTPVFFEWMCFFTSMGWLLSHTLVMGRKTMAI